MSIIAESVWATFIHTAFCLRMELTLFALVLIMYCLCVGRISEVIQPSGSLLKAKKCIGRSQSKSCQHIWKAPKSKDVTAKVAKPTQASATTTVDPNVMRATQFVEDIYPRVISEHLGMVEQMVASTTPVSSSAKRESDDESTEASGSASECESCDTPSGISSDEELLDDSDNDVNTESWNGIAQRVTRIFQTEIDSHEDEYFFQRFGEVHNSVHDDDQQSSIDSWRSVLKRVATAFSDSEEDDDDHHDLHERSCSDPWRVLSLRVANALADAEEGK
jgi:hypothetical protein